MDVGGRGNIEAKLLRSVSHLFTHPLHHPSSSRLYDGGSVPQQLLLYLHLTPYLTATLLQLWLSGDTVPHCF